MVVLGIYKTNVPGWVRGGYVTLIPFNLIQSAYSKENMP